MTDASGDGGFKKQLSKLRHDMRTPVGHMIGYAEMLREEALEEDHGEGFGDLTHIANASKTMLDLVEGIGRYSAGSSRLEHGRGHLSA